MTEQLGWETLKAVLAPGQLLEALVVEHREFGLFMDTGHGYSGFVPLPEISDKAPIRPADFPPVGARIPVVLVDFNDRHQQLWLSARLASERD
jgi:ribosomal protein S1